MVNEQTGQEANGQSPSALLVLEDGSVYWGKSVGCPGETFGELVFNTGMTGYQEVLTDPSYQGQIVVMTYPEIGIYGVNAEDVESEAIHVAGFVMHRTVRGPFNARATGSLPGYLADEGIVAIEGVDTRRLTRHLRTQGVMRGAISTTDLCPEHLATRVQASPAMLGRNLAGEVSPASPSSYPGPAAPRFRVVLVDSGRKENIVRDLTRHGCGVTVVPYDAEVGTVLEFCPDGVLFCNGPGDPEPLQATAGLMRELLARRMPVAGICLGHQILGLALGGKTYKMRFGHRGANHPVKDLLSGRILITTQNHGFAVDPSSLGIAWAPLDAAYRPSNPQCTSANLQTAPDTPRLTMAELLPSGPLLGTSPLGFGPVEITHLSLNDGTLEGLRLHDLPAFSVQYHPEACPGPHDAAAFFQEFIALMETHRAERTDIHTILIIGWGPMIIGQAAEFDYSGTQALKALREAGYRLVVVNSNSATIMTDPELSDAVYIEPLTVEFLEAIIAAERPEALLPTLGGQTALNLAVELAEQGILAEYGVELIGAPLEVIHRAEDRALFKETMLGIGLDVPQSQQVGSIQEALQAADQLGYPIIVRPSFTLGGTGSGVAYNAQELTQVVAQGLIESPVHTVLLEESVSGWKEYELEVVRDHADNAAVVCSIENLDPMGIHTGDSITVAPIQTLTDREYQRMRDAAINVLRAIGVDTGGSNIQFAVEPDTGRMVVIEMNPRVSRSSALASKATGYPIAKVAALLAVGYRLDEIANDITHCTTAAFEPALDYVVVKLPRFQVDKFPGADPLLSTYMKSVGEVMTIGRTFKEALGKALRSLELDATPKLDFEHIPEYLGNPTPERLAYVFAALRRGYSVDEIHDISHIDRWFLSELARFIAYEDRLRLTPWQALDREIVLEGKALGMSDRELGDIFDRPEEEARRLRKRLGVEPVFKMVDTCAAEFEAATPYFYSTYGDTESEATPSPRPKVVILGSGPNRIGQGIEFDYANVHAVWALQEEGYEVIMVNSNPETVSTDYDTSDRLYFEPLAPEDVLAIVANEQPLGVVVGFGGQTPLRLARTLERENVPILGTSSAAIALAEDRERFGALLDRLGLRCPPYGTATSVEEALAVVERLGYPVLVRPSYILGGRGMEIVDSAVELRHYVTEAARIAPDYPVLIDRFLENAVEIDVDVLTDGRHVWVAGLMEQIEEAGVHSGDSACVLPPVSLSESMIDRIEEAVACLVRAMGAVGLMNVQLAIKGNDLYVLEANPRASRTVPFVSKAIGVPLAKLAAKVLVGRKLCDLLAPYWPYPARPGPGGEAGDLAAILEATGRAPTPWPNFRSVKEVVLPFGRFPGSDVLLGPEMHSTGEVMGFGQDYPEAFAKAQIAAGNPLPKKGLVLVSLADRDKREGASLIAQLHDLGFEIVATRGTARVLEALGIPSRTVLKVGEGRPDVVDLIAQGRVSLVVNTPSAGRERHPAPAPPLPTSARERGLPLPLSGGRSIGYRIRTAALDYHVPYVTTLVALQATVAAIRTLRSRHLPVRELNKLLRREEPGG